MARTAKVKLGDVEATFDGDQFVSENESLARILNSALQVYRTAGRPALTDDLSYQPDPFAGMIRAIAKYSAAEVVSIDPMEGPAAPEGAVY